MHIEQKNFVKKVKKKYPIYFTNTNVLDVGSLNINGTNKRYFKGCNYLGLDLCKGKNVDIICPIHLFETSQKFDVIICTEMLEHDKHWKKSLLAMKDLLKKNGLLILTAAGINREEHGTSFKEPCSSPFTNDYYRNIDNTMLSETIGKYFDCTITLSDDLNDIYFVGIKI